MKIGIQITLMLFTLLLAGGCASYQLNKAQMSVRSSFADQNFDGTVSLLQEFDQEEVYKSKDRVLFNLEMGMATHFNGQYDLSSTYFSRAESQMEQLYTKSISRGVQSFIFTNDHSLEYDGEDYEDIYLNMFKSLNYLHRQDIEGALVEVRRISYKLSQLEYKYEGLAQAFSRSDTLSKTEWKTGKTDIQNSALGHYLSAVLFAKSNRPDNARIEFEKLTRTLGAHTSLGQQMDPDRSGLDRITDGNAYNVLITGFAGRAPVKQSNDARIYLPDEDLYLKFALPSLHLYNSRVHRVQAVFDDSITVSVPLIEEMDEVAREVYKIKEPIIYARAFARSFVKAIGINAASRAVHKKNKDAGLLVNIFGKVGQELTEQADLRSWQTMPGKAFVNVIKLSPGEHTCIIRYLDDRGRTLYTEDTDIYITSGQDLQLIESLYWN